MKKALCLLLVLLMLLSFTGCSDLFGAYLFCAMIATGDDRAEKEEILSFVTEHEEELLQAIEDGSFSDYENKAPVISVSTYNSVVTFYCGGVGIAPASTYVGFFYTPQDDITAAYPHASQEDFIPFEDGFLWKEESGDNLLYAEKICDCFYYYEETY